MDNSTAPHSSTDNTMGSSPPGDAKMSSSSSTPFGTLASSPSGAGGAVSSSPQESSQRPVRKPNLAVVAALGIGVLAMVFLLVNMLNLSDSKKMDLPMGSGGEITELLDAAQTADDQGAQLPVTLGPPSDQDILAQVQAIESDPSYSFETYEAALFGSLPEIPLEGKVKIGQKTEFSAEIPAGQTESSEGLPDEADSSWSPSAPVESIVIVASFSPEQLQDGEQLFLVVSTGRAETVTPFVADQTGRQRSLTQSSSQWESIKVVASPSKELVTSGRVWMLLAGAEL